MLADDMACNTRNKFPATVYANPGQILDLYGENIEVDYRGYEVTVENFIRLLTGMTMYHDPGWGRLYLTAPLHRSGGELGTTIETLTHGRAEQHPGLHGWPWRKRVSEIPGQRRNQRIRPR